MRKTSGHMKTKSNMASGNSHASFVQEAFRKLSVDSHHLLDLKQEQEDAVICKFLIFRAQELHTRLDKEDNFTK